MRTDARKDEHQAELVAGLRKIGATVEILSGKGIPDLLVGFRKQNFLLEVKTPGRHVTPAQLQFFTLWRGQAAIVETLEDARAIMRW